MSANIPEPDYCGQVAGISVPVPHFGCLLSYEQFDQVRDRLVQHAIPFVVEPYTRYEAR
ncbi:hypothetical protein [Pontibacter sp. BAB1700]|uniref:hypothetical protein n=1 Tax=Pontibacter sp. BAB1700 TaxID=1144253 RepID=UPI00026BDA75|nr:bleomycin resistance protein [Pontibacter sp. BAB1700]